MAHLNQERWSKLVDAKLRNVLVTRDNMIFNNRYEGDPKAGKVKIPVRDTEVAVKTYNKATGVDLDAGSTAYIDLAIDQDEAVNELMWRVLKRMNTVLEEIRGEQFPAEGYWDYRSMSRKPWPEAGGPFPAEK